MNNVLRLFHCDRPPNRIIAVQLNSCVQHAQWCILIAMIIDWLKSQLLTNSSASHNIIFPILWYLSRHFLLLFKNIAVHIVGLTCWLSSLCLHMSSLIILYVLLTVCSRYFPAIFMMLCWLIATLSCSAINLCSKNYCYYYYYSYTFTPLHVTCAHKHVIDK